MDMLLSTGERVSMSLMSMAINDLGVPAISFTGSQAGILTDYSHNNARILDIKPIRIVEELEKKKVIVLAGFQGVDPKTKEITTLGRGGTDTTAVAMAAHFRAQRCEMLKDVDGILSADPRIVKNPKALPRLTYDQLLDMTYWGAKVLHYRSVELAKHLDMPIYVGLAHGQGQGSIISKEPGMYEDSKVLSINSHKLVGKLHIKQESLAKSLSYFHTFLRDHKLPWPQILDTAKEGEAWSFYAVAPVETLQSIQNFSEKNELISFEKDWYASVTATCQGAVASDLTEKFCQQLEDKDIRPIKVLTSPLSLTGIVHQHQQEVAVKALHELV